MTFRPNYRGQRAEKARVKEQRRQERLLKRQENAAKRKAAREAVPPNEESSGVRSDSIQPDTP